MNWEAIGAIGELIGALAVIITLIYLAVQLRQNTTGIQTSAYQQWAAMHGDTFSAFHDKELNRLIFEGCEDSRNLTQDNYGQFITWWRQYFHMQQAQFYLYEKGVIEEELWECNLRDIVGVFRFPGVRQLWDAGMKTGFTEKFIQVVENTGPTATMMYWDQENGFHPTPYHSENSDNRT